MTSNIGSQYIQKMEQIGFGNGEVGKEYVQVKERVLEALKEYFKPEFLNRLDDTVIFDVLVKDEIKQIVRLQVADIAKRLAQKEIVLEVSDEAVALIAEKSFDPHYGARPIKRYMQTNILNKVAQFILLKKFAKGSSAVVTVDKKGEIVVEAKRPKKIPSPITQAQAVAKK
jgi:ATP-dependent Clp protease ATP-binding subunit ClpA